MHPSKVLLKLFALGKSEYFKSIFSNDVHLAKVESILLTVEGTFLILISFSQLEKVYCSDFMPSGKILVSVIAVTLKALTTSVTPFGISGISIKLLQNSNTLFNFLQLLFIFGGKTILSHEAYT